MIARTLPPVHSPLTFGVVARAWKPPPAGALASAISLLREMYGSAEVLLTDSGTHALAIALQMVIARRPDAPRVALPGWACYDLATAAMGAGARVLLYDLDPVSLAPDLDSLDRVLAAGVAGVVVVHPFGLPVDVPEIQAHAARHGAVVIEDAAQAIGATVGKTPAGGTAPFGVLSFGRGKGWTGGGGGALLLNRAAPRGLELPRSLPARGMSPAGAFKLSMQWLLGRPSLYAIPSSIPGLKLGQTLFHPPSLPRGMSPQQAATMLATASLLDGEAETRRANAAHLAAHVVEPGIGRVPPVWPGGLAGWLRLPIVAVPAFLERARTGTARRLGVMPGYPIPLGRLPGFQPSLVEPPSCPGADLLAERVITLPTHGQLERGDLSRLVNWLAGT